MTVKCQICDTEYKHCPECDKTHSYKTVADNPTCYKIYIVLYELRTGIINQAKAKDEFAAIGITEKTLMNFKLIDAVRNRIAEIVKEDMIEEVIDSEEVKEIEMTYKKSKKNK